MLLITFEQVHKMTKKDPIYPSEFCDHHFVIVCVVTYSCEGTNTCPTQYNTMTKSGCYYHFTCLYISWPFDQLNVWPADRLTSWLFDQLTVWPAARLTFVWLIVAVKILMSAHKGNMIALWMLLVRTPMEASLVDHVMKALRATDTTAQVRTII